VIDGYEIPKDLVFRLSDITERGGLVCSAPVSAENFKDALEPPGQVLKAEIRLEFSLGTDSVLVQGLVSAEGRFACSRCLCEFEAAFTSEFEESFSADAEFIDIMSKTRQAVVLSNEIKRLCREDCKGLCPVCGANLNKSACACKTDAPPPFAVLKNRLAADSKQEN